MKRIAASILALIALSSTVHAQYTNLVFEGAGVRGVAYAGVIQELEQRNILGQVKRVGGTSAGAIAALTLSLGYSGKEIEDIIYKTRMQKFNDGRFFFAGGLSVGPKIRKLSVEEKDMLMNNGRQALQQHLPKYEQPPAHP